MATASARGISAGIASRARSVETSSAGIDDDALEAAGRVEAGRARRVPLPRPADDEAAVDRRRNVVGVALQLARPGQQLLLGEGQLEEVVGGAEAGDDRRGAGAEPAGQRDLAAQAEGDAVGGMQALEGAHDQVVAAGRDIEAARVEGELAGLLDLQLEIERERRSHHVIARPEIGRGGGNADQSMAARHPAAA